MSRLGRDYQNVYVADDAEVVKHMAPRHRIHLIPAIHMVITGLHIFSFMALITIAVLFTNLDESRYFQFTDPIVSGKLIPEQWKVALMCTFFVIDAFTARIAAEVIGEWRQLFVSSDEHRDLSKALTLVVFDLMTHWVRNALYGVFLFSQVSFALSFAIGDMAAHWLVYRTKVDRYMKQVRKETTEQYNFFQQHWSETSLWLLVAAEVVGLGLIQVGFAVVGYFKSDYFAVGPPVRFFGLNMDDDVRYAVIVVYVFFDQLLSSYLNAIIIPWLWQVYDNRVYSKEAFPHSEGMVQGVYVINKLTAWLRTIVVLNLSNTQFIFTGAFFLAELIYSVSYTCTTYEKRGVAPTGILHAVILRGIQGLGIVILSVSLQVWKPIDITDPEGNIVTYGYFQPPPPFFLLGEYFTSGIIFWVFAFYAFADRTLTTLVEEIIKPYIAYVIEGMDEHGIQYSRPLTQVLIWVDNISRWVRIVFSTHFILSSFYFSLVMMIADVITSVIVQHMYILYKTHARDSVAVYHELFGDDVTPDMVWDRAGKAKAYNVQPPLSSTSAKFD